MFDETPERAFEIMLHNFYRPLPPVTCMIPTILDFPKYKPRHCEKVIGVTEKKPGRNEPCPCGSMKKYKKCCYES